MDTGNSNDHIPCSGCGPVWRSNRLAERARYYFDQPPEASQDQTRLEAAGRELYFRELRETADIGEQSQGTGRRSTRPRPSAEDIRIHTWLFERMAAVDRKRHGLWWRLRRLLFGTD
jgi:hypothetical protein